MESKYRKKCIVKYTSKRNIDANTLKPEEKNEIIKKFVKKRRYRVNRNKKLTEWKAAYNLIQENNKIQQQTEIVAQKCLSWAKDNFNKINNNQIKKINEKILYEQSKVAYVPHSLRRNPEYTSSKLHNVVSILNLLTR